MIQDPKNYSALSSLQHKQQGAVLVISLILLFVMTGLVVASVNSTRYEERMAGATRDMNYSFQAAESALLDAENFLASAILPPFDGTTTGFYQNSTSGDALYEDTSTINWKTGTGCVTYSGTAIPSLYAQPCYYIEELEVTLVSGGTGGSSITIGQGAPPNSTAFYRITARGVGLNENSETILQSVFKR